MEEKRKLKGRQEEERGVITLSNTPGLIPQFIRVTKWHGFRDNTDKKLSDKVPMQRHR